MGTPETARGLLHLWITQYKSDFQATASHAFEASVLADALEEVIVEPGSVSFRIVVASPLLNNYKALNGGGQAAVTSIAAEAASISLGCSPALFSISIDYLSVLKEGEVGLVQARLQPGSDLIEVEVRHLESNRIVSKSRCRIKHDGHPLPTVKDTCCTSSDAQSCTKVASACSCSTCQRQQQGKNAAELAKQQLLSRARHVSELHRPEHCWNFDTLIGAELVDMDFGKGWCRATLPVTPRLQDASGRLHAGSYPALVDLISSAALATQLDVMSLSINITVDFLGDVPVGQAAEIEANVIKAGRSLAFSDIFVRNKATHELVARGTHTEFTAAGAAFPPPPPNRVLFSQQAAKL